MFKRIKKYFRVNAVKKDIFSLKDHRKVQPMIDNHLSVHPEDKQDMDAIFKAATVRIGLSVMEDKMAFIGDIKAKQRLGAIREPVRQKDECAIIDEFLGRKPIKEGDRINLGGSVYATALEDEEDSKHLVSITSPVNEAGIFYGLSSWFKKLNPTSGDH